MKRHTLEVEELLISELSQHPENANNGDVDTIVESIAVNGFYSPVIVQRSTGYVIVGNHRLLAAMRSGATSIPGIRLDVDDLEAKRIMVADNRTARLGHDDEGQLANLLEDLHSTTEGLSGTGYDYQSYEYLMALVNEPLTAADLGVDEPDAPERATREDPGPRLAFSITPIVEEDGEVHELVLSRTGYSRITANDLNLLRKALGQEPLGRAQLQEYGVPAWK